MKMCASNPSAQGVEAGSCEFEARLINKVCFRIATTVIQRNSVLRNKIKQNKKTKTKGTMLINY